MIGAAITVWRIPMTRQDHLGSDGLGARNRGVDVFDLEPEQQPIAGGSIVGIADGTVMVILIPSVQLQHQLAAVDQAFVVRATMRALTVEQLLIPAAAGLDVVHTNQWLWIHRNQPGTMIRWSLSRHSDQQSNIRDAAAQPQSMDPCGPDGGFT